MSHLEVFCIDRPTLLAIAADYENAALRLRRWTLMRSLAGFLIANRQSLRSGGRGLQAEKLGEEAAAPAPAGSADDSFAKQQRKMSSYRERLEGAPAASAASSVLQRATSNSSQVSVGEGASGATSEEVMALREDVRELKASNAEIKAANAELKVAMAELLRRTETPTRI